jgi:hypothetical protein
VDSVLASDSSVLVAHTVNSSKPLNEELEEESSSDCSSVEEKLRTIGTTHKVHKHRVDGAGRKKRDAASKYVGVSWSTKNKKWQAQLWDPVSKKNRHLGYFETQEAAHGVYQYHKAKKRREGNNVNLIQ